MPCTTVLVGKNATNDHSTMIARTDDGFFDVKKMIVIPPDKQPRRYKGILSHVEILLPDNPMRYTSCPNVDPKEGLWPATGINAANVGMTATETTTSNPRVLAADPMVRYQKAKRRGEKDIPGGIGEEDFLTIVLPYIHSARAGVLRLGSLLEQYGTYESNGIGFNDADEVWWMETIGGHHWIARRLRDDECIVAPNQFGMDTFDFEDAFGAQKAHLCSADLREFIRDNCLDLNQNGKCNPRDIFGSHTDNDHLYNTPRAWFMGRYLAREQYRWDGENADFGPESDNIPFSFTPDRKVTVEDVKYLLSGYYQGTPYNPYSAQSGSRGKYRSIGISRTGVTALCQIRGDKPKALQSVEWICFGSTSFNAMIPIYTNVDKLPKYLTEVTTDVSTENFYWPSRLIGALADSTYAASIPHIERYQSAMFTEGRRLMRESDSKMIAENDFSQCEAANEAICRLARELTTDTLNKVLFEASNAMKNGYNRGDN